MTRRSIFTFVMVVLAMLALAVPALAGGWAVVTLDALPREVRAGESFQLGFMVLQHGKTPTNKDLDGNPLKPVLTGRRQATAVSPDDRLLIFGAAPAYAADNAADSIRAEARQQGPTGHYVVDLVFPSDGMWDWQITLPTYYVQDSPSGSNAAVFAPLTVLPAGAPAAAPAPTPEATTWLGISTTALRWAGLAALLAALAIGLYTQRGILSRRLARSQ
jgi:hypothetical protein